RIFFQYSGYRIMDYHCSGGALVRAFIALSAPRGPMVHQHVHRVSAQHTAHMEHVAGGKLTGSVQVYMQRLRFDYHELTWAVKQRHIDAALVWSVEPYIFIMAPLQFRLLHKRIQHTAVLYFSQANQRRSLVARHG